MNDMPFVMIVNTLGARVHDTMLGGPWHDLRDAEEIVTDTHCPRDYAFVGRLMGQRPPAADAGEAAAP